MANELKEQFKICNLRGEEVTEKQLTAAMHASECHPGEDCSFRQYFENIFFTPQPATWRKICYWLFSNFGKICFWKP